jgi:hypothetical protein
MSEEKIPKTYHTPEESPIPVPPAEGAWSQMKATLDARLPVIKSWYTGHAFWSIATVVTVSIGAFLWVATRHKHAKQGVNTVQNAVPPGHKESAVQQPATTNGMGAAHANDAHEIGRGTESRPAVAGTGGSPAGDSATDGSAAGHTAIGGSAAGDSGTATAHSGEAVRGHRGQQRGRSHTGKWGQHHQGNRASLTDQERGGQQKPAGQAPLSAAPLEGSGEKETLKWVEPEIIPMTVAQNQRNSLFAAADSTLRRYAADLKAKGGAGARNGGGAGAKNGGSTRSKALATREANGLMAVGLSFGQPFPLGQESSSSSGGSGSFSLSDYVPELYLRAYAGRWSAEAAFGFHSPQYTTPQVVDSTGGDTLIISGQYYTHYNMHKVEKLYYTDFPFTLRYRVTSGLWLGAGFQYSRLWGGIGQAMQVYKPFNIGIPDSVSQTGSAVFRQNAAGYGLLARTSWRVLAEADYKWRGFTLELRYGQALNSYLPKLPDGSRGNNKNNSLTLRLAIDLWRHRWAPWWSPN